jgi:hypothetical protein
MVLSRIFAHMRKDVSGNCRRLNSEELYKLHSCSDTDSMIKSRMKTLLVNLTCMGDIRNAYRIFLGSLK